MASRDQSPASSAVTSGHTPGPWVAVALGGSSTVLTLTKPGRNDTRIPAYAYDDSRGYCVAYPFLEDDGEARRDFVCFSHADARLTASAPDLLEALKLAQAALNSIAVQPSLNADDAAHWRANVACDALHAIGPAISKAEGQ